MGKIIYISFDYINKFCMAVSSYTLFNLIKTHSFDIKAWFENDTVKTAIIILPVIVYIVSLSLKLIKAHHDKVERKIRATYLQEEAKSIERRKRKEELDLRSAEFEKEIREEKLRKLRLENEQLQKKIEEDKNYGT